MHRNRRECCLTRKELSQLYWLKKEIEREIRRVEELEALATGCTAGASGMPGSGGLSDKTAIAGQIADCKTLIETKRRELVTEYNRLLHYIKDVDDAYIRNILKYRYIECLTWRQVKVVRFVRLFYAMMVLWKNPQETLFLFPHRKSTNQSGWCFFIY